MKIDYSTYLRDKPQETDPAEIGRMDAALNLALSKMDISGEISRTYYKDGRVKVCVNGEFYNVFDSRTGKFFSGYAGG